MIDLGAGSTMEAWDPSIKSNLSYSHAWAASPAFVVPDDLFGIAPLTPGWSSILIAPQPGNLTSGSVTVPTARGQVAETFTTPSGGPASMTVTIPTTATARVALPGVQPGQQVTVDGTPITATALTPDSPLAITNGNTLAVVTVGSGTHTITTTPGASATATASPTGTATASPTGTVPATPAGTPTDPAPATSTDTPSPTPSSS
jgi:alpha-L-rhamnosidase